MDLKAAKKLLHKIETLINNLDESEKLSRLEHDLLLNYVRALYENLLSGEKQPMQEPFRLEPIKSEPDKHFEPTKERTSGMEEPVSPDSHTSPQRKKEEKDFFQPSYFDTRPEKQEKAPFEKEEDPADVPEKEAPFSNYQPEVEEPVRETVQSPSDAHVNPQKAHPSESQNGKRIPGGDEDTNLESLFETPRAIDLSDRLGAQPLSKIEAGLGINERILTINELFGGNISAFEETLSTLNSFSDFEEAKNYLIDGAANKYHWGKEEKFKKASQFIRLVRRRYV